MRTKKIDNPAMALVKPLSTWAINNFPTRLKNRYAAYCKASDTTMRDHLEYLIAKELRDAGVDIPTLRKDNEFINSGVLQRQEIR